MELSPFFRQVVRGLQLPVPLGHDEAVFAAVYSALTVGKEEPSEDVAYALSDAIGVWAEIQDWNGNPKPPRVVSAAVDAGLSLFTDEYAVDSAAYFKAYAAMRRGNNRDFRAVSHETAVRLLSRTRTIGYLITQERYSCTQVAHTLGATEKALDVSYKAVQAITNALGVTPQLDKQLVLVELHEQDSTLSELLFPDSDEIESCEIAGDTLDVLDPAEAQFVKDALVTMVNAPKSRSDAEWSYFQMFQWCLTIVEFYDHPASYLYEFNPRGDLGNSVMLAHYPGRKTGNPILNNAKAVPTLNRAWANNRYSKDALAVVLLLELLESLPYGARRDVARVLRAWIVRIRGIAGDDFQPIPELFYDDYLALCESVADEDTGTYGAIEQRVIDALCVLKYGSQGWVPRGLGDSVNASNLSRKKLGDIEFANIDLRQAVAVEAHGGSLSVGYVQSHQRSLERIVERRLADSWNAIEEDPSKWGIEVVFIAHEVVGGLPLNDIVCGVPVSYDYVTYEAFIPDVLNRHGQERVSSTFDSYFLKEINKPRVRQSTRERVDEIIDW